MLIRTGMLLAALTMAAPQPGLQAVETTATELVGIHSLAQGERVTYSLQLHAERRWEMTFAGAIGGKDVQVSLLTIDGKWQPVTAPGWEGTVIKYDHRKKQLVLSLGKGAADSKERAQFTVTFDASIDAPEVNGNYTGKVLDQEVSGSVRAVGTFNGPLFVGDGAFATRKMSMRLVQVDGGWQTSSSIAAGINKAGHSGTISSADKGRIQVQANIGSDAWVPGDKDATYTLNYSTDDDKITGTFTGTFRGEKVHGRLSGESLSTGWQFCQLKDGKPQFSSDLGSKISNWNNARWIPYAYPNIVDASAFDGLEVTITTANPRDDAWVDVAVNEDDGTWYYARDAVGLNQKINKAFVPFDVMQRAEWLFNPNGTWSGSEGNFDENFWLNTEAIARLAVGVINGHGIGQVDFEITDVKFAKWKGEQPTEATVSVSGETVSVNGQENIPGGMFGFHVAGGVDFEAIAPLRVGSLRYHRAMGMGGHFGTPPKPEYGVDFTVNAQYDRGANQQVPNAYMADEEWRKLMRKAGEGMGNIAKEHGDTVRFEWWNEPYLDFGKFLAHNGKWTRWEERQKFVGRSNKVPPDENTKDGDPVKLKHGRVFESLVWRIKVDEDTGQKWFKVKDPTRISYWSGNQIAKLYAETLQEAGKAARAVSEDTYLVPGWGFRWQEDDWLSWEILYKHTIDTCHEYINGINEHHYQGHTEGMIGGYEAIQAYTDIKYNIRPKIYNTEANDLWDSPARGNAAGAAQQGKFQSRKRMIYNFRDILGLVAVSPDKAEARAIHAIWGSAGDNRVRVGETFKSDKHFRMTVTAADFADKAGDIAAGDGETLLVLKVVGENLHKKKKLNFDVGELKIGDAKFTAKKAKFGKVEPKKKIDATVVYAIPADKKDDIMIFLPKAKRNNKVVHVAGEFIVKEMPPYRKAGIDKGEWDALYFMRNLRGRLLSVDSSDDKIWTAASIDEANNQLTVLVYNDDTRARTVKKAIAAPAGTTFKGGFQGFLEWEDDNGTTNGMREEVLTVSGKAFAGEVTLAPFRAVTYTLKLDGTVAADPNLYRVQTFAGDKDRDNAGILFDLKAGDTARLPIALPSDAAASKRAWLRVVLERCDADDGSVVIGGQTIALPAAYTPCNSSFVRDVEIDPAILQGVKELEVVANPSASGGNGFLLCMASIITEK